MHSLYLQYKIDLEDLLCKLLAIVIRFPYVMPVCGYGLSLSELNDLTNEYSNLSARSHYLPSVSREATRN